MKRIGISTGGGDAPGLNAVIRAAVKTAIHHYNCEVFGIRDGLDGLLFPGGVIPLDFSSVRGILPRGGTILGTASRANPFARKVERDGKVVIEDVSDQVYESIRAHNLDALLLIGGDGTLNIARKLYDLGLPVIGVPKTIGNDVGGTEYTFGFDTAVGTAMEAIDRLHTTAESHHRVMVLEVMGRDAGFIALHAGLAGGADVILIPEIPFTRSAVCRKVTERIRNQAFFSIIVVAEGAHEAGGEKIYTRSGDEIAQARLGGMGAYVADFVAQSCQVETRVTVLGHLQRGGSPSAFDRVLATRFGAAEVRAAAEGKFGHMVTLQCGRITTVPLAEALAVPKRVDVYGDAIQTARDLTICLGDG